MPFDWSAMMPWIIFIPFFVWLLFQSPWNAPLTPAMRRRALVIGSIGSGVGVILAVICLSQLLSPGPGPAPAQAAAPALVTPAAPKPAPALTAPR